MLAGTPITQSGAGIRIDAPPTTTGLAATLVDCARRHGFALVQHLTLQREDFVDIVRAAGTTADHRFGTGSAELLDLDADPQPDKVVTGRAALPLHTDGALVGTHPRFIILYCRSIDQDAGSGETQICAQDAALIHMPTHLRRLFSTDWQYLVHDHSHFPDVAGRWMSIPSMLSLGTGRQIMTVALPFDPSDPSPGWNVRLPYTTDADATHLFGELDVYLRGSAAFYSHPWAPGDLMIIDNWQVLHGRSAITGNGPRHLYRGQLQ